MSNAVNDLINKAKAWNGYLEKKSNANLDDFTANAGSNNFTCFARDYKIHTGYNLQGQAWCAMFVSEVFVQMFGLEAAKKLLAGKPYHYCPTGVNQFKAAGRWHIKPEPGDVIFFTNGTRAYHTGIVTEVTSTKVKTIEGNTSGASGVIENGGGVCQKSYSLSYERIMGYGRPDWSIFLTEEKKSGWKEENGGWRFYNGDTGECVRNAWHEDKEKNLWYWFDGAGMMVTNTWYKYNSAWYYLGPDGAMCKSQLVENSGKIYAMDADGKMITEPVRLTPDKDGALQYPGLVK
ncbi:putative cell wall binding repeat protein [Lacrimispora xylanisolvens]|uniref:Putative cell wall binding repeat protein n=1 Tax=Lacrimispora xylanisolvens TaxID=384636 RepID=A0A2S6HQE2_9FIRM|nr:CHAP domain-containing protein [Hungatella xylanolytica]PPK79837.1 putative cell wall binding repeat protein [Hungatella xylanolytica]